MQLLFSLNQTGVPLCIATSQIASHLNPLYFCLLVLRFLDPTILYTTIQLTSYFPFLTKRLTRTFLLFSLRQNAFYSVIRRNQLFSRRNCAPCWAKPDKYFPLFVLFSFFSFPFFAVGRYLFGHAVRSGSKAKDRSHVQYSRPRKITTARGALFYAVLGGLGEQRDRVVTSLFHWWQRRQCVKPGTGLSVRCFRSTRLAWTAKGRASNPVIYIHWIPQTALLVSH